MPVFFRIVLAVDWLVALSWLMRVLPTILLRSRVTAIGLESS
jgi:hypothetical protein